MFYDVANYTFSHDEILKIINKDLGTYSTKSRGSAFINANLGQYELVCNTWVLLAAEYTRFGWKYLKEEILKNGLYATICSASIAADQFVNDLEITHPYWRQLRNEVFEVYSSHHPSFTWLPDLDAKKVTMILYKYPKRFTPAEADCLESDTLNKFLQREKVNKKLDRVRCKHFYLISQLKRVINDLLPWDRVCDDISRVLRDPANFSLTPGVCSDAKTPYQKLNKYYSYLPTARHPIFGVQFGYSLGKQGDFFNDLRILPSHLMCVPKSYKSYRLIAPEPSIRALRAKAIENTLRPYVLHYLNIPIEDQEVSRAAAQKGSLQPSYAATIDMSQASDSITKGLWRDIFPTRFVRIVDKYLPTYVLVNGQKKPLYGFATSGNPLTFILESIVFYAVDVLGLEYCILFDAERPEDYSLVIVFGDDQIVATFAAETTIDLLQIFGFKVNKEKSFFTSDSKFREACGRDYYDGYDISAVYWPRKVLEGQSISALLSNQKATRDTFEDKIEASVNVLISLQQRLYYIAPGAAMYLADVIVRNCPELTVGSPGTLQNEVWGYNQSNLRLRSAYGAIATSSSVWHKTYRKLTKLPEEEWERLNSFPEFCLGEPFCRVIQCRPSGFPGYGDPAVLHYCYSQYLKHGPSYASELDRLLGISQSRVKEVFTTQPKPEMVMIPK